VHETGGILHIAQVTFALLFVAAIASIVTKRIKMPLSVGLVLLGFAAGLLARLVEPGEGLLGAFAAGVRGIHLTPDLILFIFLPTLVFESAYNLDVRQVTRNLVPILTLAVPGLLLSTAIVGLLLSWLLGLELWHAMLFGALISATDPVAVISLFREVGAPKRLVTLVEGESLFNDAGAIVFFSIILGMIQGFAGTAAGVASEFIWVFVGGTGVGLLLGVAFARLIETVDNDELVEITLTTVLAYVSFIVAEHFLHVSGVMAVVAAGMTLGSYGRTKISPPVVHFMHSFWEYMAYVANAMIFLLVGVSLPGTLAGTPLGSLVGPVLIAYAVAFVARAVVVFGFVPALGALRLTERIDRGYQVTMWWGGLRGAIALALALSLLGRDGLPAGMAERILALTAGVVLLTLVVNALSIKRLVQAFGLDQETPAEKVLKAESIIDVQRQVERTLLRVRREAILLPRVVDSLIGASRAKQAELKESLAKDMTLTPDEKLRLHRISCIGIEKSHIMRLFSEGNLGEATTRDLRHDADVRVDHLRRGHHAARARERSLLVLTVRLLRAVAPLRSLLRRVELVRLAAQYESARGRFLAAREVLAQLERWRDAGVMSPEHRDILVTEYDRTRAEGEAEMDEIALQFPEYVGKVHLLVGTRLSLHTEETLYERLHRLGLLTDEIHGRLKADVAARFRALERSPIGELDIAPRALLQAVPLFSGLGDAELDHIAGLLRSRSCVSGEVLFREGDPGDTMYLIGRGVIRVWRGDGPDATPVATLTAGDFVGEMACMRPAPRTASAQTTTVASLMVLRKVELDHLVRDFPQVGAGLDRAFAERRAQLDAAVSDARG